MPDDYPDDECYMIPTWCSRQRGTSCIAYGIYGYCYENCEYDSRLTTFDKTDTRRKHGRNY